MLAIVTGANKGIGLSIVKLLHKERPDLHILLTARSEERGKDALKSFSGTDKITFHQLDIDDAKSINELAEFVEKNFGGVDILINNAGIATKGDAFDQSIAKTTIGTNYFATLNMCQRFLPLIKDNGRLVNVSSMASSLNKVSPQLQQRFRDPNITIDQISGLLQEFIDAVGDDTYAQKGWPRSTYGVSKMGVTALTRALAREQGSKKGILINCMCPGWCVTDMTSNRGNKTADQGAEEAIRLALLPKDSDLTGAFTTDGKTVDW